jgi:Cd2+/Zn2+-exporting ATPase
MRYLRDPQVVLTVLCGIALVVGFFNLHPAIPYLSVAFGSYFALKAAWVSLRERSIDVNFLMVFAAIGAVVVGQPLDAAALLFLFSLSSTLESLAMARTRSAIEGLIKLRPDTAIRIRDGEEERVRVEDLAIGDQIKIPSFESIPVDGVVLNGNGSVDQSAMTGESIPVAKSPGEKLLSGTRNMDSALVARVESTIGDSTLDKIVALVQDAQENKASGERISTWFGQRYTFFVIGAFIVALVVRLSMGIETQHALYESLTLLVALSPCALVISTPATTLSALAWAARNGVLVRGGEFIEKAGRIDTIALDKTGTLTLGKPRLVEICVCAPSMATVGPHHHGCTDEDDCWHDEGTATPRASEFLLYAASAEQYAPHPVADALRSAARAQGLELLPAKEETTAPGMGIGAQVQGRQVYVGKVEYIKAQGVDVPEDFVEHVREFQKSGMTVALLSVGRDVAALGFMDSPRVEAENFLNSVKAIGVDRVVVLSGDTPKTVESIAGQLGISEHRGALMPNEKAEIIQEMGREGRQVMMIGDGINDAPPLAAASVGVAMGGLGSDIALNAADVVLMHDRLDRIPELIRLGRKTNGIIRANLFFATGVIVTLTIFSLLDMLRLPVAVVGHEGSTVLVILNGLRVLRGPNR